MDIDNDDDDFEFEFDDDAEEGSAEEDEDEIISFPAMDVITEDLRRISPEELRGLGVSVVAYVRPTKKDGTSVFQVCAADGTILSVMQDYQNAMTSIWNNDLCAVRVH